MLFTYILLLQSHKSRDNLDIKETFDRNDLIAVNWYRVALFIIFLLPHNLHTSRSPNHIKVHWKWPFFEVNILNQDTCEYLNKNNSPFN